MEGRVAESVVAYVVAMGTAAGAVRAGSVRWVVLGAAGAALLWLGIGGLRTEPVLMSMAYGASIDSEPGDPFAHQERTRCAAALARWTGDDSVRQTVSLDGGPEHVDLRGAGPIDVRDEAGTHTVVAADGTSPECGFRTEDAIGIAALVAGASALGVAAVGMRRERTVGTERSSEDPR